MTSSSRARTGRGIRVVLVAMVLAFAALAMGTPTASATTYNESTGGSDTQSTTTLNYTKAHSSFGLRIYVKTNGGAGVSDKYAVSLRDKSGQVLRSFTNQGDRTYTIGANVTSVVVNRTSGQGATTYWRKNSTPPPACSSCGRVS